MSQINVAIATSCILAHEGLKKILSQEKDINIMDKVVSFPELLHSSSINPNVILVCPITVYDMGMDRIKQLYQSLPDVKLIVFNVDPKEEDVMVRLYKIGVMGLIYKGESPSIFAEAIKKVYSGEIWVKRKIVLSLLKGGPRGRFRKPLKIYKEILTAREVEILNLIAEGHKNASIAEKLYVSEYTVKFHIQNIFRKLNVKNRLEAALHAFQKGSET